MTDYDVLLSDTQETTTGKWATVTQASPLRVKVDGDTSALGFTPDSLVAGLAVSERVWVQIINRRLVVVGRSGGVVPNGALATMAQDTIKGRADAAGTGAPTDLSVSQVNTILGITALTAAWSTWTPTLTNLTLGSGSVVARSRIVGKTGDFLFIFTLGSGSAVGSGPMFTLPFTPNSTANIQFMPMGLASALDFNLNNYPLIPRWNGSTAIELVYAPSGVHVGVSSTSPFTWGTSDQIMARGSGIEIA